MESKFLDVLRLAKDKGMAKKNLQYDFKKIRNNCADLKKTDDVSKLERDIIVKCHTIEKGLSHKKIKKSFGKDAVEGVLRDLSIYSKKEDRKHFYMVYAVSILQKYIDTNLQAGQNKNLLPAIPNNLKHLISKDCGADRISANEYFKNSNSSFDDIAKARHSVRLYDCNSLPVSNVELLDAIKIAQLSPSACNRQATRVYIIKDHKKIDNICEIQRGSKGFYENSGALLIVAEDLRQYYASERRLPMFDAGLFTMSLSYALYERKLGTCILNGSFSKEQEDHIKKHVPINDYEMIGALILVSKIPENETIGLAKSFKRDTNEIVTMVD